MNYNELKQEKEILFKRTLELKRMIYNKYPVGGVLHIVLDDGNLKDGYIKSCIVDINELDTDKGLFLECANNLLKMTQTQRLKLYRA